MVCPNCKVIIPDDASFCSVCGGRINSESTDNNSCPTNPNWKNELKAKGGFIATLIVGVVIMGYSPALLFLHFLEGGKVFSFYSVFLWLLFHVGFFLLIFSVIKISKIKKHNAEVEKRYSVEIEMERQKKQVALQAGTKDTAVTKAQFYSGIGGELLYRLEGTISTLEVYQDRVLHIAKTTARSYVAGKFFNGTKEYMFEDLTNIQYREATPIFNGYLQFEYPGAMNYSSSSFGGAGGNYNNENSFIYDVTVTNGLMVYQGEDRVTAANRIVGDAFRYMHGRIMEEKRAKRQGFPVQSPSASVADELKKYSELYQSGVITQEEFNEIKKKLI